MAESKLDLPGTFDKEKTYLLSGETLLAWQANLLRDRVIAGPGISETVTKSGRIWQAAPGNGTAAPLCDFGHMTTWTENGSSKRGIKGGFVTAGIQSFEVDSYEINTSADAEFCVWLEVNFEVNRIGEISLPGFASLEAPTWKKGSDFPGSTTPGAFGGEASGKAILPIGSVKVENQIAALNPTGCGTFYMSYCPGNLYFSRLTA